jgi:hypothetical protein
MSFQTGNNISLIWKKLKKGDYTVRPFEVYKLWEISSDSNEPKNYYGLFDIQIYRALYPENYKYYGGVANLSSSLYERVFTTQSLDPKLLWYYLDHNFYTEYSKDKFPNVITDYDRITYLAESSSMMVLPRGVFGEGIRRGSVKFTNVSQTASRQITMADDGIGNLKDLSFDETKIVGTDNLYLYLGFNEKYREYNLRNKPTSYVLDGSPFENLVDSIRNKNISYQPGILTTDTTQSTGVCSYLDGGYYEVRNGDSNFNFSGRSSFAFSFWVNIPPTQSNLQLSYNPLFDKRTTKDLTVRDRITKVVSTIDSNDHPTIQGESSDYPFDIKLYNRTAGLSNEHKIEFSQKSGTSVFSVTSSAVSHSVWNHIICQKSASYYQIWVNGILHGQTTGSITSNTSNTNRFFIGSNGTTTGSFSGYLDEIRIYGKGLTTEQITYLGNNSFENGYAYQTSRIGNVFYKQGMIIVSDPRPKYANTFLGQNGNFDFDGTNYGFTGSFRSTTTFYEHEITCKIRKSEFNFTQNWTIRQDKNDSSQFVDDYATSSFFNPYITTIGLYNDKYDLVAIGKLSSPLEKRDDVDMNVIIRFDV